MEATIKHNNVDYRYEIIPVKGQFDIKYAGSMVAAIKNNGTWQQITGKALPPETLRQLILYIEAYFA